MVLLGAAILVAGLVVPGKETVVVSTLIVVGAGISVAGLVADSIKQVEIGLQGFKVSRDAANGVPSPWLETEAEMLNRIAVRVLGSRDLGRDAVERCLTKVRRHRRDIPRSEIDATTIKTLISELHRKDRNRQWSKVSSEEHQNHDSLSALDSLSFGARVVFALSCEFMESDVASILGRSEEEIIREVRTAEAVFDLDHADAPEVGDV
jgi:hypothetical protein